MGDGHCSELRGASISWLECDEMTSLRRIAIAATCIAVIGAPAIVWWVYKEKAIEGKLAEDARLSRVRAEQGDAKAQSRLAFSYYYGKGAPQDYTEALRWYRKAADQGLARAQYGLGFMYSRGEGVPQDYAEAVRWCRKAADQGYVNAQYALGVSYFNGQGVPQDYAEAARWYRKAADQSEVTAQSYLGIMYRNGQGVPRDYAEALRWLRKAAVQGDETAQMALAIMYYQGQGAPQNYAEAIHWGGKVLFQAAAHCFVKINVVHGRWTSLLSILLLLPILFVRQSHWGRFTWVSLALCSAGSAAALAHELLLPTSFGATLAQALLGTQFRGVGDVLWFALLATLSALYAFGAVREAVRGTKRGEDHGQPQAETLESST